MKDYKIPNNDLKLKEHTDDGYVVLARGTYKHSKTWRNLNPIQKVIMITLIMMANHKDTEWWDNWKKKWVPVKRGQLITSLKNIKKACGKGVSIQNIRTAIVNLEKMEFLTNQSTKHYRLITIEKYDLYQCPGNYQQSNQQSPNKAPTINNNDKHILSNSYKYNYSVEFEKFWQIYPRKKEKRAAFDKWKRQIKDGYKPEQLILAAKRYAEECKGREERYIKHAKTFLGPRKPFEDYLDASSTEERKLTENELYMAEFEKKLERLRGGG